MRELGLSPQRLLCSFVTSVYLFLPAVVKREATTMLQLTEHNSVDRLPTRTTPPPLLTEYLLTGGAFMSRPKCLTAAD